MYKQRTLNLNEEINCQILVSNEKDELLNNQLETERDMPLVDQNHLSNKTHDNKQLPLSKFMETYLNQKGVDANVLSAKEHNIYQFFKVREKLLSNW